MENNLEEVKKWLNLAKEDLLVSELLLNNNNFSNSVYHSQQASEKAAKAILVLLGEQVYEHKISTFFYDLVYTKFPLEYIEEIYFNLTKLETHWLKSRYILKSRDIIIDPLKEYNKKKASDLNKLSKEVFNNVLKFLKEEFDFEYK